MSGQESYSVLHLSRQVVARSLAHELGQKLGCGAHLATLRRVSSGKFDVANATEFEEALSMPLSEFEKRVIPFLKLV